VGGHGLSEDGDNPADRDFLQALEEISSSSSESLASSSSGGR